MTIKEYLNLYKKCPCEDNKYSGWEKDHEKIREFNKELISRYPWLTPFNNWSGKKITDCIGPNGEEGFWPGDPEKHPYYDYEYTILDDMPNGWRIAFGDQMCEEIDRELRKFNYQDKYKITQIKEKWGELRWYDNGTPVGNLSEDYREISTQGTSYLPSYDKETEFLKETGYEHYIPFFDRKDSGLSDEEIEKYNRDAILHYRVYKIVEKCTIPDIIYKYTEISRHICIDCGKPAKWLSKGWISPYCDKCASKRVEDFSEEMEEIKNEMS